MKLNKLIIKKLKKIDRMYLQATAKLFLYLSDCLLNQMEKVKKRASKYPSLCKTKIDKKALKWAKFNPWFGKDDYLTEKAFLIHDILITTGVKSTSSKYYSEIDRWMYLHFKDYLKKYYSMEN